MHWIAGIVISYLGAAVPVYAASVDCHLAHTQQEKAICSDAKVSALDRQTTAAYQSLLAQLSQGAANAVKADEQTWTHWRDASCPAGSEPYGSDVQQCLLEVYTEQLAMLRSWRRVDGAVFYPRLYLETVAEDPNATPGYGDASVGTGRFAWLVIDHPNSAQSAWNAAMLAQVVALSSMHDIRRGLAQTQFIPKGVEGGTVSVSTTLNAANSRYVSVEISLNSNPFGAAHGSSQRMAFDWWVDARRPMVVQDIFPVDSSWKRPFANLCWRVLKNGAQGHQLFIKVDKGRGARKERRDMDKESLAFSNWLVDGSGITIIYGEYSIAPYDAGILTAHLGWGALKPYMRQALDVSALPRPLPGSGADSGCPEDASSTCEAGISERAVR